MTDKTQLPNMTQDIPTPPPRLMHDRRILNTNDTPEWESRRASKMRERFPVPSGETVRGVNLVAPVQPSLPRTYL